MVYTITEIAFTNNLPRDSGCIPEAISTLSLVSGQILIGQALNLELVTGRAYVYMCVRERGRSEERSIGQL